MGDRCRTHWEGCWRDYKHHECAVARIDYLHGAVQRLTLERDTYQKDAQSLINSRREHEDNCHDKLAAAAKDVMNAEADFMEIHKLFYKLLRATKRAGVDDVDVTVIEMQAEALMKHRKERNG